MIKNLSSVNVLDMKKPFDLLGLMTKLQHTDLFDRYSEISVPSITQMNLKTYNLGLSSQQ